jgi:DNA-binding MarR family transcriptional regulator
MRLALAGTPLTSEEFAVLSYLHANGPRTLSQAAGDLGLAGDVAGDHARPADDSDIVERVPASA